ncbi:hypothetical protein E3N88_21820 [Mikania micrantha]|uniref:Uncharacterized protein n=1 Tax=Mikania micrantha TaxID=192012 RepID=A0A5N6N9L3_9ASTR|nr:hypothetical protein E3N88_21820 [Mikania micrantha]
MGVIETIHEGGHDGLELSGLPFFWALRKPAGLDSVELPYGFLERTHNRGVVWTRWASQKFKMTMRAIQGAMIVASTLQIVLGFNGFWRNVSRFLSPLSATPVVAFAGFGIYEFGSPGCKISQTSLPRRLFPSCTMQHKLLISEWQHCSQQHLEHQLKCLNLVG